MLVIKKNYVSQPPNFKYGISDYISVFKSMYRLQNWKYSSIYDERVEFELKFANYIGCKYAISVNGCNTGIDIALNALQLKEKDEIISAAINFYGTHLSALNTPAKLVLCGINPKTLNIDANEIRKKLNKNTKAVLVTHMNGLSADMDAIIDVVKQYNPNIKIIEDVARSCGALYNGKKVGTLGDIAIFSFQGKKNISTLGEGGMIVTNDELLYQNMVKVREFGGRGMDAWGSNFKLSRVQCAVGIEQIKKLDRLNSKRINVAKQRNKMLDKYSKYINLPIYDENYVSIYTYYTIILKEIFNREDRDNIRNMLRDNYGICTTIANEPTYLVHKFINQKVKKQKIKECDDIGGRIINLPIHFAMSKKENYYITNSFIECLQTILDRKTDL